MSTLTKQHRTALNTLGLSALMNMRASGELPECTEVQSRIAIRAYWSNPANWQKGDWFFGTYSNDQYRNGVVRIRKDVTPGGIVYRVVGARGSWCDSLSEEQAKRHLKAHRNSHNGWVLYCKVAEAKRADRDYNFAISR